jgi:hypothetical protein
MDTYGLRAARCSRGLTAHVIAERTKLSPIVISAIENERFDQLPAGIYARAYLRAYFDAIGLEDPNLIQKILDVLPAVDVELETIVKCRETDADRRRRYRIAAAIDAALVTGIAAAGVLVCATVTGAGEWDIREISIALLALWCPTLTLYLGLLGATGVGTAGARLLRVEFVPSATEPLNGTELVRRSRQYFHSETLALVAGRIG